MRRRDMLKATGLALAGLSTFPLRWAKANETKKKILYFTRSEGFQHSPVARPKPDELSFSEKLLVEGGKKHGVEVVCTKDGSVFDGDLDQYDAFAFYTQGDLTSPKSLDGAPPMTRPGKRSSLRRFMAAKGLLVSTPPPIHSTPRASSSRTRPRWTPTLPCSVASSSSTGTSRRPRCTWLRRISPR